MSITKDPCECAERGDLEFFKGSELDVLLNTRDSKYDNSVLALAAAWGHLSCCEEIYSRCPSLLYLKNKLGNTALHLAAYNGKPDIIKFLASVNVKKKLVFSEHSVDEEQDLLTMVNLEKTTALHSAVLQDYLASVKALLEADLDNKTLGMVDRNSNTALHLSIRIYTIEIVRLLVEADPDFEYCPNNNGETPLLIALQEALSGDATAVEIRKMLVEKQARQCTVRTGGSNWTLLHHATYKGDLSAIEDIIRFCPECVELVDNDGQSFLHLAAKFAYVNVVNHVLGISQIANTVLNGQDNNGNTPLHIAGLGGHASMAYSLLYDVRVEKMTKNKQGQSALDVINFDYDKRKAGVYGLTELVNEKEIKDRSDFDLLVGALIAAVSFSAGIAVPGGYFNDGPYIGNAILANKLSFRAFVMSNAIAFLLALYAVFSHFCAKRLHEKKAMIYQLNVATYCSLCAIFALMVAFITGSYAVLAITSEIAITICVLCCCFFLFAFRALWRMVKQHIPSLLNTLNGGGTL